MKFIKLLVYPFSLIYGCITWIRNILYDRGILKSFTIPGKSITIGNLSVGGTGKSPHVSYLIELLLQNRLNTSTLSRGYGRRTKGLLEVNSDSTAIEVGDEPLQYKVLYGDQIDVVVSENRKLGVEFLRNKSKSVILLDDAFQHRKVKAGLQILLTTFDNPYFQDHLIPSGYLREFQVGRKRADILIVSKSPTDLTANEKKTFLTKLDFTENKVFFSSIVYGKPYNTKDKVVKSLPKSILLVTGIANPTPLVDHLKSDYDLQVLKFPDHYNFGPQDIARIQEKFGNFETTDKAIVTTEKDLMRLKNLKELELISDVLFIQPITVKIDREQEFNDLILSYAREDRSDV